MNRTHEHIEGLLSQRPEASAMGEGLAGRVAEGIRGVEPGADAVASAVMPASIKAGLAIGAVGAVGALVWVSTMSSPAPAPGPIANNSAQQNAEVFPPNVLDGFILPFKDLGGPDDDSMTLFGEGTRLLADARRVGQAFMSVFPQDWTSLFYSPGAGNPGSGSKSAPKTGPDLVPDLSPTPGSGPING